MLPIVGCCGKTAGFDSTRATRSRQPTSCVPVILQVIALDFVGSGLSGGDYVTLGAFEVRPHAPDPLLSWSGAYTLSPP
jgi:hypothetical protein